MDKMMNRFMGIMAKGYVKANTMIRNIRNEEVGASELVVLVALIVVVLAVVLIFRTQLSNIVNSAGSKVIKWINAN